MKEYRNGIKHPALMVISVEFLAILSICVAIWPFTIDKSLVVSAFMGGMLFIIPNSYFMLYAFRYRAGDGAGVIARSFFQGQMGKLALTAAAFALVFRFNPSVKPFLLIGSYGALAVFHIYVASLVSKALQADTTDRPYPSKLTDIEKC